MADKKISALTASATPLAGTEVLPIVQSGSTVKVSVANLTAGRAVSTGVVTSTSTTEPQAIFTGWSPAGGANASHGTAQVGGINDYCLRVSYDVLGPIVGATYIDNTYNDPGAIVRIRTRTSGTPVINLTARGTGNVDLDTGNLVVGTAGKGIDFSANTHAPGMTSELLDWYEEGTWTPLISADGTGSPAFVSSAASGKYTRIGNIITVTCLYTYSSIGSVGNSFAFLSGLPFTSSNDSLPSVCAVQVEQSVFDTKNYQGLVLPNSSLIAFQYDNGGGALYGGAPYMLGTSFPASGTVRLTATYFV